MISELTEYDRDRLHQHRMVYLRDKHNGLMDKLYLYTFIPLVTMAIVVTVCSIVKLLVK